MTAHHTLAICTDMIEARLENIETKISYQEDLVEELNKVVYQQQQKLNQLEAVCATLTRHIQSLAEAGAEGRAVNEMPPHY
jgi:SlyX protein